MMWEGGRFRTDSFSSTVYVIQGTFERGSFLKLSEGGESAKAGRVLRDEMVSFCSTF